MSLQLLNALISLLFLLVGAWVLFFVVKHAVADGIALADRRRIAQKQAVRIEQAEISNPAKARSTFQPADPLDETIKRLYGTDKSLTPYTDARRAGARTSETLTANQRVAEGDI